ncbi:MAG: HlyD family efflux transporter periplasmic adaptor subunit [Actinomycetota bacterium]|nr:HlyD family efflux transporter periplasmic adaptor subunit [Actinomycetota bacterium]
MKLSTKRKSMLLAVVVIVIVVGVLTYRALANRDQIEYRTAKVERGMIISSISASGQIASNNIPVTTQATGIVKKIYVKEGDIVKAGDKLLTIELDKNGQVAKAKAWASYLSAKSALESAKQSNLVAKRDIKSAEIDLLNAQQSKLSLQRELTLAKSALVAAQDAWDAVKDRPITDAERKQKELALQAAQHAYDLAQMKYDNADASISLDVEQTKLMLKKELESAKAAREAAQDAYYRALESTSTTEAERRQKELSLQAAQYALELAQMKYDNADKDTTATAQQTKLSLQRELELAKAALIAAQDAWDAVKNKPASDADRKQKELALQAAQNALDLAQSKYDSADASIERANLSVSIAKQGAKSDNSAVEKAKADVDAAWLAYQATLPTVIAPVSGRVADLNLVVGMVISGASSSGGGSSGGSSAQGGNGSSSLSGGNESGSGGQKVATIISDNRPIAKFNVSEVDIIKVRTGQKATITLDALPGKTYTGKVVGIDRTGTVSSGVTTYLVTIQFDSDSDEVQPNMAANASIITETKDNVLLIPSNASRSVGNQTTVTVLKNGQPQQVPVTLGLYSDSQVEVVSGLSEGDEVVIETLSSSSQQSASSSSPFSGGGFGGMRPGGGMFPGGSVGGGMRSSDRH